MFSTDPSPGLPRLRDRHPLPQGGEGIVKNYAGQDTRNGEIDISESSSLLRVAIHHSPFTIHYSLFTIRQT
jgi:hypothetical protein